jgi:type II secretory pathway component PulF
VGLSFASALKAFLRQDPDVMMVGEVRDADTARTAIQAALTGHLVLTTLHTNTAAAAVTRLVDIGIEPYLLASTLTAVVAFLGELALVLRSGLPLDEALDVAGRDLTGLARWRCCATTSSAERAPG